MTPPKKIEIRKGIIVGGQNVIAELHNAEDMTYFSEDAIRETLKQVVDDANRLIEASTTIHKIKIDANKYIPHVIELMLKGASND